MHNQLKHFFDQAWQQLKEIYLQGSICSERHMQCELFAILKHNPQFNELYQIFVEPRIENIITVIPDLIIVSNKAPRNIIAGVELKYTPHCYPKYEKDLNTLTGFISMFQSDHNFEIPLVTNPDTGQWEKRFIIDEDFHLIYCIITKADAHIIENFESELKDRSLWRCDEDIKNNHITYLQYVGVVQGKDESNWKTANVLKLNWAN